MRMVVNLMIFLTAGHFPARKPRLVSNALNPRDEVAVERTIAGDCVVAMPSEESYRILRRLGQRVFEAYFPVRTTACFTFGVGRCIRQDPPTLREDKGLDVVWASPKAETALAGPKTGRLNVERRCCAAPPGICVRILVSAVQRLGW